MIRHEFSDASTKEENIHPSSLFNREHILAERFVKNAPKTEDAAISPCPVSGLNRREILFEKWGVEYAFCPKTWSISMATKPSLEVLNQYFRTSDLARYRATEDYQRIVSQTRKDLWANWLEWIENRLFRYLRKEAYSITDIQPKNLGWVEMLARANFVCDLSVSEPIPPIKETDAQGKTDVVTLMDVLQRNFEPDTYLNKAYETLKPGGILLGVCRSGPGFDILTLRGESDSIFPYDHVTLPSPEGLELALQRCGFKTLEVSTPGLFDADLVIKQKDRIPKDQYFQRYLAVSLGERGAQRLQSFLQANGLSSHLRFVAQKPIN